MTFSTLGTDTTTKQPVYLYKTSRTQGLYIVGLQGMGKSGLLENLITDDIKQGLGVCVLDPHGELIDHVIARLPGKAEEEKVILLDIADYIYPFGINLFTCSDLNNPFEVEKTVDRVMHIFDKLLGVSNDTPLISQYLLHCTHTLVANPGFTMAEIPLLLTDKNCRQKLIANVKKMQTRLFWQQYELMKPIEQLEKFAPLQRRVEKFLQDITLPIVGQSRTTIDMQKIMDESKILLVKLDRQLEQVTTLIGSMIVALILNASAARKSYKHFHLYADEFQHFATEDFATLIEEARKAGIGITMAHQNRAQLELSDKLADKQLKARTLNVGSLVAFRVPTDAYEIAGHFDITPQPAWEEEIEKEWVEVLKEEWHERKEEVVDDGVEEIKTPVPDLILRIVPNAPVPIKEERKRTLQLHPNRRVNEFIQNINKNGYVELHNHMGFGTLSCSCIADIDAQNFVRDMNTFLYEMMREQNPYRELPVNLFEIMVRATTPAFFDKDRFNNWVLEAHEGSKITLPGTGGRFSAARVITFPPYALKRHSSPNWNSMSPYDYCSCLFLDGVGSYRMWEERPKGLEGNALANWFTERQEKVPDDLMQEYRLFWTVTDENQLTAAFHRYEQVLRNVLKKRLKEEIHFYLQPDKFFLNDDNLVDRLQFPIYNFHIEDVIKNYIERLILPIINQRGSRLDWQYTTYVLVGGMYRPMGFGEHRSTSSDNKYRKWFLGEEERNRLVRELNLDEEINHIVNQQKTSFEAYIREVREVLQILAREPMQESSGISQPRKRTQLHYLTHPRETITHPRKTILHPQRTYADIANQIASELIHLPIYTARVKLTDANNTIVEHTITTREPEKGMYGRLLDDRVERIKQHTRTAGYTRLCQDVELEIAKRQSQCIGGSSPAQLQKPQQPLQPQGRLMPICSNCGSQNRPGANFCNHCGEKL